VIAVLPIGLAFLGGKHLVLKTPAKMQLLFTVFAFCSMIWSVAVDVSIGRVVSYVLLFALLISGSMFKYTEVELNKIKYALAWSSRLTALVMLIFAEYVRGRFRLMGIIEEDPNYLCAYLAFGVIYAFGVLTTKNMLWKKILAVVELIVYFYLVLISGSRGGLLAIVVAAVVYFLTYGEKKIKYIGRKIVLIVLVAVLTIVMIDYLPEYLKLRFTIANVIEDGGSGRTELWKQTFELFASGNLFRQLFGVGTATVAWCFSNYGYSEVNVTHNMFIETLAELGVIGLVLYSLAIFAFIKAAFKIKDKYSFAVIFCMFIMSLSTSIYTFKPYFNIMLFIIMLQNMQTKDVEMSVNDERKNTISI
jgi:O-antigen ligase